MNWYDVKVIIITILMTYLGFQVYKYYLRSFIIEKGTKDLEINPKWIISELQTNYYGFSDMDIVLVESKFGNIPRFRYTKSNRFQLLVSEDISTKDIDNIAQFALLGKIKIKYGLWFPNKPAYWLSILLYMLDGGDIKQTTTSWEEK